MFSRNILSLIALILYDLTNIRSLSYQRDSESLTFEKLKSILLKYLKYLDILVMVLLQTKIHVSLQNFSQIIFDLQNLLFQFFENSTI